MGIAVGGTYVFLCVGGVVIMYCGVVFYELLYTNTTEYGIRFVIVMCHYDG